MSELTNKTYSDLSIDHLEGIEHVRHRPGMYIGKLGDGTSFDDGIYVLLKEVLDNSIDEFRMNYGNMIEVNIDAEGVTIRDYGRGIPQGKLIECVSIMNTSGKYGSEGYAKSVGLNGVGLKAVNALSSQFIATSVRDGMAKRVTFAEGVLTEESELTLSDEKNGTRIFFVPDKSPKIFGNYAYNLDFVERMMRNYCYLNPGLTIVFNGQKYLSKNGLLDLLSEKCTDETLYPIIHLKGPDIEIAFTHTAQSTEENYSFVNGQYTIQGGTHQSAYREAIAKTIKEFYAKNMELSDIRSGCIGAIAISVQDPVFESQTKVKLGSKDMAPEHDKDGNPFPMSGITVNKFVNDFVKKELDNYLHKNTETANILLKKIQESEKERKAIASVTKAARERAKKASLHNKKLRDCRIHLNDARGDQQSESSIFITEGDSASGSITKSRDANTQAVFSLKGKPFNSYGLSKKIVYENEEFNLLQAALNIEDGLDNLRYNKIIIATDADVDGMHIRLLLLTFFLQFFPNLVKKGHVYILQTPLFRVRTSRETRYCYNEEERLKAIDELKPSSELEITRFKGLGEISPDEFKHFIGKDIRLDQVTLRKEDAVADLLSFYMGDNTPERQNFIVENLVVEEDLVP